MSCSSLLLFDSKENEIPRKPLSALPPWAEELDKDIDGQIIGRILNVESHTDKRFASMNVIVKAHLNPNDNRAKGKDYRMIIRIYNKKDIERIQSLIMKSTGKDSDYIISFKTIKKDGAEWFKLMTIDPYIG